MDNCAAVTDLSQSQIRGTRLFPYHHTGLVPIILTKDEGCNVWMRAPGMGEARRPPSAVAGCFNQIARPAAAASRYTLPPSIAGTCGQTSHCGYRPSFPSQPLALARAAPPNASKPRRGRC